MIIQIAGTNGAGKSTVVRAVMAAGEVLKELEDGYDVAFPQVEGAVRVLGLYGPSATGGCDMFNDVFAIHDQVRAGFRARPHVLWEGGTSHGGLNQTRGPQLVEELGTSFVVVLLTASYAACIDGINARRAEKGLPPFVDDQHVRANYTRARNYTARMRDAGARVVRATRDEAPRVVLGLLRG